MTTSQEWHLVRRPHGELPSTRTSPSSRSSSPEPGEGQVLVRNTFLSRRPLHARPDERREVLRPAVPAGPADGRRGGGRGDRGRRRRRRRHRSADRRRRHRDPRAGLAHRRRSWPPTGPGSSTPPSLPRRPTWACSACPAGPRTPGCCASASSSEGDRVFVSAAAGAVGSLVGQIARLKGAAQVVGSAGGPEKTRWLLDDAGFNAAVDYKAQPIAEGLKQAAPERHRRLLRQRRRRPPRGRHRRDAPRRPGGAVRDDLVLQRHRAGPRPAQPDDDHRQAPHPARLHRLATTRTCARSSRPRSASGWPRARSPGARPSWTGSTRRSTASVTCCPVATPARCWSASDPPAQHERRL